MDQSTGVMTMPFNVAATIAAPMAPVDLLATDLASGLPSLAARAQMQDDATPPSTEAAPSKSTTPGTSRPSVNVPLAQSQGPEPQAKKARRDADDRTGSRRTGMPDAPERQEHMRIDAHDRSGNAEDTLGELELDSGMLLDASIDAGPAGGPLLDSPASRTFSDAQLLTDTRGQPASASIATGRAHAGYSAGMHAAHATSPIAVAFGDGATALHGEGMYYMQPDPLRHGGPMLQLVPGEVRGPYDTGAGFWGGAMHAAAGYAPHTRQHAAHAPAMPVVGVMPQHGVRPGGPPSLINSDLWRTALNKHHQLQASLQEQLDLQKQLQDNLLAHKGYIREAVRGACPPSLTHSRSMTQSAAPEALSLVDAPRGGVDGSDVPQLSGGVQPAAAAARAAPGDEIDPLLHALPQVGFGGDVEGIGVEGLGDAMLPTWEDADGLQDVKFDDDDWADLLDFDGPGGIEDSPFGAPHGDG